MTDNNNSQTEMASFLVSATFTVDSIQAYSDYLMNRIGLPFKTEVAPYNQVFQQLLNPLSEAGSNHSGVNLFLIRLEDFARDIDDCSKKEVQILEMVSELSAAFIQFASRSKVATVVMLLPASTSLDDELASFTNTQTDRLATKLSEYSGIATVSNQQLIEYGFDAMAQYDAVSDELAHVPYIEDGFAALALVAVRYLHMLKTATKKVLVLDCDNTIWKGVVGEDGVDGIELPFGMQALQRFAVKIQKQGVLICLASKNVEEDVLEVFDKRPDMILKVEHIVSHRVNWIPKYQNLESLASELNLGLDSFVFMDDNPVECGEMREALPQVLTIQLPEDSNKIPLLLKQLWVFDKLTVTEEDAKRTQMYRENSARQQLESSTTDISAFLASLELDIRVEPPLEDDWPRVAQLTQRTNQFNFTTIRRNETEMRLLADTPGWHVLKVNVKDRFGDYGLVGEVIANHVEDKLLVDSFLLSCRVLGRGVEHAMLRHLADLAIQLNATTVEIPFAKTAKNEPARAFAEQVMGPYRQGDELYSVYHITSSVLVNTVYIPGSDPEAVLEAKRSEGKNKTNSVTLNVKLSESEQYEFLTNLQGGNDLAAHIKQLKMRVRDINIPVAPPLNHDEEKMLALWESVFGISGLGMEDDYIALGGTSLLSAKLFAEIARVFGVKLRLTQILDAPTARQLLTKVYEANNLRSGGIIKLKSGSGRNLFLIHDGDGETLLYLNLAKKMPDDVAVYGIEPYAMPNIPLAHFTIDEMANYYYQVIKQVQPSGPYYLSGMCAGGLLSYVVASKLEAYADKVALVAMLDSAVPHAPKKFGRITKDRAGRVKDLIYQAQKKQNNIIYQCCYFLIVIVKKLLNTLYWEISKRLLLISIHLRLKVLNWVLRQKSAWPHWVKPLSVREIYNHAELHYDLPTLQAPCLLVKASSGDGGDIAFKFVYADNDFGWSKFAKSLTIEDTLGGHASMLQEGFVEHLAKIFNHQFSKSTGENL